MLASTSPVGPIYRVGYAPDPWTWVPWEYVGQSTGRWDDPRGQYRVIYAGSTPEACFAEVLAQFRPDPMVIHDTTAISADKRDGVYPAVASGVLPRSWLERRRLGTANLDGTFVDIDHKKSIAALRPTFLADAVRHGLADFDAAAIRIHRPRPLTQGISRYLCGRSSNGPRTRGWVEAGCLLASARMRSLRLRRVSLMR